MTDDNAIARRTVFSTGLAAATGAAGLAAPSPAQAQEQDFMPGLVNRAWEVPPPYGVEALRLRERPVPAPGHGEVLMRIRATALNARDRLIAQGSFRRKTVPENFVPLADNAGDVVAVGAGVAHLMAGDRVICGHYPHWDDGVWHISKADYDLGASGHGFLRQYAVVPASGVTAMPGSLDYGQAATLVSAGIAAWRALKDEARVDAGEWVLTLGTGGVSVFGLQIAKMFGARVAITSSSDGKLARMRELGADATANYRTNPNWGEEISDKTGGVDVVLDNAGPRVLDQTLAACGSAARVILIGMVAGFNQDDTTANRSLPQMIMRNISIAAISHGSTRMLSEFVRAVDANGLTPLIHRTFGFDDAPAAFDYFFTSLDRMGKIVIEVA